MPWRSEDGATAVEYSLIVASIAAIIVLVLSVLGNQSKEGLCSGADAMEQVGTQANPNC